MDTSSEFENYRKKLSELNEWHRKNGVGKLNEADTRFHLINELFVNCLGWNKDDIKNEQAQDSVYADYTFYINSRRTMIVEAKRESIGFEIPVGFDNRNEYKISSLIRENGDIGDAINQVINYSNNRGVEFAVVSNGHQIITFLTHRNDGLSPLEGNAIIFTSLDKMERNFFLLWQILSKPGISQRRLALQLSGEQQSVLPLKLSAIVDNYPKIARRNELQADLQIVSEVILESVNSNEEVIDDFLKETYCNSGSLSQYALISKSILNNRYSLLFEDKTDGPIVKEAVTKKGLSPEVFGESLGSRPILLLGDVGSGKSMFINYFVRIEATELVKKSFTIYVDLGSKAALAADLKVFFIDELFRIFYNKYEIDFYKDEFVRGVYDLDLIRFGKSIYGRLIDTDPPAYLKEEISFLKSKIDDKSQHLKSCFQHISKGWKRQIIIFMDNVDQRDEPIQEDAFFIANEIASGWPAVVFLTLRPSTYTKSKKIGALTGYHPKAFTILPPRLEEVIAKRLLFAIKIASGEVKSKSLTSGLEIKLQTLTQFLEILIYSFNHNKELIEFIDNVCNGNVRKAIEYLTIFIGSGHINTKKILEIDLLPETELSGRRYIISSHEFIRAIIFREHTHYFPDETEIANLFDITQEQREHFVTPILLDYLLRYSDKGQDGFIKTTILIEELQNIGFKISQIEYSILRSIYKGLIETEARKTLNVGDSLPTALRITTVGSYHLKRLLNVFNYIDAVVIDVPIVNQSYREKIKDDDTILSRLDRAVIFCDYLDFAWNEARLTYSGFNWIEHSEAVRKNIKEIRARIESTKKRNK